MTRSRKVPKIEVHNVQRAINLRVRSLQLFAEVALAMAWQRKRISPQIGDEVLVSLVSDKRMAQLHEQFCGIAGPTDVLTFQHGEIIISAQAAARQALAFRSSVERELRLYLMHGLLHLCGYGDKSTRERANMERIQRRLLGQALRKERLASV